MYNSNNIGIVVGELLNVSTNPKLYVVSREESSSNDYFIRIALIEGFNPTYSLTVLEETCTPDSREPNSMLSPYLVYRGTYRDLTGKKYYLKIIISHKFSL